MAEHRPGTAAIWMLLAGFMFALMDAAMKWIATSYSPFQVTALRSLADLPPVRGTTVAAIGLTGAVGQIAPTHAFRLGEANPVAPLEYAGLIWVVMLDLAIWQVLPDRMTWVGATIIIVSGLYLIRREHAAATAVRAVGADP